MKFRTPEAQMAFTLGVIYQMMADQVRAAERDVNQLDNDYFRGRLNGVRMMKDLVQREALKAIE